MEDLKNHFEDGEIFTDETDAELSNGREEGEDGAE